MAQISNKQTDSRLNIIPPASVLLCTGTRVRASASARLPVQVPFPLSYSRFCRFCHSPIRFVCSLSPSSRLYRSSMRGCTSKTPGLLEHIVSLRQWRVTFSLRSHLHLRSSRAFSARGYECSMFETISSLWNSRNSLWASRVEAFRSFPTSTRALNANK